MRSLAYGSWLVLAVMTVPMTQSIVEAGVVFQDGFEGTVLDGFWTTTEISGSITMPSTAQAHGGSQSVQFNSTNTGANKFIALEHTFAQPIFGTFSVWIYDTGADVASSNYIAFETDRLGTSERNSLVGYDFDFSGTYYLSSNSTDVVASPIDRTRDWHQFLFDITPTGTTFQIDGQIVYSKPGVAVDHVYLYMSGPSWRPAFTSYFDDFSVRELNASAVPEPGTMTLLLTGALGAVATRLRRRTAVAG